MMTIRERYGRFLYNRWMKRSEDSLSALYGLADRAPFYEETSVCVAILNRYSTLFKYGETDALNL